MKRKLRILAMAGIAAVLVGVPAVSLAASSAPKDPQVPGKASVAAAVCEWPVNATNAMLQTKTVTSSSARFKSDTAWSDLECGALTVTVPSGMRGGLVVHVDATRRNRVVPGQGPGGRPGRFPARVGSRRQLCLGAVQHRLRRLGKQCVHPVDDTGVLAQPRRPLLLAGQGAGAQPRRRPQL